jgi:hypothetical protein
MITVMSNGGHEIHVYAISAGSVYKSAPDIIEFFSSVRESADYSSVALKMLLE